MAVPFSKGTVIGNVRLYLKGRYPYLRPCYRRTVSVAGESALDGRGRKEIPQDVALARESYIAGSEKDEDQSEAAAARRMLKTEVEVGPVTGMAAAHMERFRLVLSL